MADPKIVREWLDKADEDLNFARSTFQEGNTFYAQICFHFNQAAEKYLKSYVVAYDLDFVKTHNLIKLLAICASHNTVLMSLSEECKQLNASYMDTRYPMQWPMEYTRERTAGLKEDVEAIEQTIKSVLKEGGYV